MNPKDYLQKHKDELKVPYNHDAVWNKIEPQIKTQSKASNKRRFNLYSGIAIAASILGLIFYFALDKTNDSESKQLEKLTMVEWSNTNTSEKIYHINDLSQSEKEDEIVETLLYVLQNDESKNVKLAALRNLENYLHLEKVRIALLNQLSSASNPYIQISLISLIKKGEIKEAIPQLDELISKENPAYLLDEFKAGKQELLNL